MLVVAVIVIAAIAGGVLVGTLGDTQDPDFRPNGTDEDCQNACSDLTRQHNDLCIAIANEQEAENYANTLAQIMGGLAAGTGSLVVAGLGAAALLETLTALVGTPIAIAIVAGALLIAAILALVLVAVVAAWVTALVIASQKRRITSQLRNLKAQAIERVQANCSDDEAQACIDSLAPCSLTFGVPTQELALKG